MWWGLVSRPGAKPDKPDNPDKPDKSGAFLCKDLTDSYAQESSFLREDLNKTISLVSLKVHLVLGYGLF